jgi:site-specific DNA-methyltransferase (adenine-specific)
VLTAAIELPVEGPGFVRYRKFGANHWGNPRLVHALENAARAVQDAMPGGAPLVIGDLSAHDGGRIPRHQSHRTGRDVDLPWFVTTPQGLPVQNPGFVPVGPDGLATVDGSSDYLRLDIPREWLLVKDLITSRDVDVQWMFCAKDVEALLVDYARARGEPDELVWHAETVLIEPGDSLNHDDHIHLRIACTPRRACSGARAAARGGSGRLPSPSSSRTKTPCTRPPRKIRSSSRARSPPLRRRPADRRATSKGTARAVPAKEAPATVLHGDCLEHIAQAVAIAGGGFDLIYVDPPFNAGGKRGMRQERGHRATGAEAYADAWGGLDAFLTMLEPRLDAMRGALTDAGSLWLHLDFRAVHDAKVAADRVFGRGAFRGEIVWVPGNGARRVKGPSVTHQTILVYARGRDMIWNASDPTLREPFADTSLRMHFQTTDANGRRYRERVIGGKTYRYYADEGRRLGSVWTDCPAMNANTPLTRETTGYPTQKPLSLLDRVVRAASLEGSRVLDPMCGSGTTLVAALAAKRRPVGIDRSALACKVARERVANRVSGR